MTLIMTNILVMITIAMASKPITPAGRAARLRQWEPPRAALRAGRGPAERALSALRAPGGSQSLLVLYPLVLLLLSV